MHNDSEILQSVKIILLLIQLLLVMTTEQTSGSRSFGQEGGRK